MRRKRKTRWERGKMQQNRIKIFPMTTSYKFSAQVVRSAKHTSICVDRAAFDHEPLDASKMIRIDAPQEHCRHCIVVAWNPSEGQFWPVSFGSFNEAQYFANKTPTFSPQSAVQNLSSSYFSSLNLWFNLTTKPSSLVCSSHSRK